MTTNIPGPALYADNEGNVVVQRDLPAPTPAEGEILIEVLFSGSNPSDLRIVNYIGFRNFVLGPPIGIFKVPANLPLPDAAALTTVVQTANDALFHLFKLPLPSSGHGHIEGTLVVWGGRTAVGMSAHSAGTVDDMYDYGRPRIGVAHFFAHDIPTSIAKANLIVGGQDVLVWSGLQGTIGVLIPFVTREDAEFFHTLEMQMRTLDLSPVGRDHLMYRSYYEPIKGFIDGDLCERYRLLPADKKQQIANEFDRSVRDIERKVSDVRTRSAF
ncbi:hypothetical protein FOXYS1_11570 [Fusarium oxysporum]|uniref:RSE1/DDB1/CPSF1 C-terminal domain-containing protein n=1 Tax=Fusarium oxysporum TaxID=5507 RepID=A0A8H5A5A1_FUSOX|nr:hypothetical protein FOXYS1_11570 [Fusarium oxysporum]